ncbi:MAG: LuxR C-terminal-related transcriptional regulator [Janthinobacterium lividum]
MIKADVTTCPRTAAGILVPLPRLLDMLSRFGTAGITVVQAPAGYGKTMLLAEWQRRLDLQGVRTGWLTIGPGSQDQAGLLQGLAALLDEVLPAIPAPSEVTVPALRARLMGAAAPFVLLLDDIHLLTSDGSASLAGLLHRLPAGVHVVTASRQTPTLDLALSQNLAGALLVDKRDLRFTMEEVKAWMGQCNESRLSQADIALLVDRTEGWAAGLSLAIVGLAQAADPRAFVSGFSGEKRSLHAYFARSVMAGLPAAQRDFLLTTCVPDRLCAELCNRLTGRDDGQDMLDCLEAAGVPIEQLDDERVWYRHHGLFAAFLRRQQMDTNPAAAVAGHLQASGWYRSRGQSADALRHAAFAPDATVLASLLDKMAESLVLAGEIGLIGKYAADLPDHVTDNCPSLLLVLAWTQVLALQCDEAEAILRRAEAAVARLGQQTPPVQRIAALNQSLRHQRLLLAAAADDAEQTERRARVLQAEMTDAKSYQILTVNALLIQAQREQFNFGQVEISAALARVGAKRWRAGPGTMILNAVLGPAFFAMGATATASSFLETALADCVREYPALAATAALPLAEIMFECNELPRARALLDEHLPAAQTFGFADHLISGHLTHARLAQAGGDTAAGLCRLEVTVRLALEYKHERFRIAAMTSRIHLLLHVGRAEEAWQEGRREGLVGAASGMGPSARSRTVDEDRAMAWVRLAQSSNRSAEALPVAKRWSAFCAQRGAIRSAVRWHLLTARLQLAVDSRLAAQQELRRALKAGAPSQLIRSFVSEGAVIQHLLEEEYGADPLENSAVEMFALDILAAFGRKAPRPGGDEHGPTGRLSGREIEILALVSSGLRNREIGNRLGLTEGSVKWYMQQVYDKVGSRRRSQAVDRARYFGLIA